MRLRRILVGGLVAACAISALAADTRGSGTPLLASDCDRLHTAAACGVAPSDLKFARAEFQRGLDFSKSNQLSAAYDAFSSASKAVPRNVEYLTAREIARQQLVFDHIRAGNNLLDANQAVRAAAEFREAARLDPSNQYAQQRLQDALGERTSLRQMLHASISDSAGEISLAPKNQRHDFHLRGDTRTVIGNVANVYGIRAVFDDSLQPRSFSFDVGGASFREAMTALGLLTHTFSVPLSPTEMLIVNDSPAQRQEMQRMLARTFYFQDTTALTELTDMLNVFRTIFDVRFGVQQPSQNTIVVRAAQPTMDALMHFVESSAAARPQVMIDMRVYEVNHAMLRSFGLQMPLQWSLINLSTSALAALQQQNIQDLVNQLISSGGINQAGTTAIAALLQQLQNQQANALLKNPFGTFGGGFTRFALPFAPSNFKIAFNESRVQSLQHVNLRAAQGDAATLRIGSRYPILNASFAPIYNNPAISRVIGNQSFQAPFPSFTFEDLGLTLKATPAVHEREVTLDVELTVKSLGSQSFNGVPVIGNREYKGAIRLPDGQSGILTGIINTSEQHSLQGLPGLAQVPILGRLTSDNEKQVNESELLIVITPHIMRARLAQGTEIEVPAIR